MEARIGDARPARAGTEMANFRKREPMGPRAGESNQSNQPCQGRSGHEEAKGKPTRQEQTRAAYRIVQRGNRPGAGDTDEYPTTCLLSNLQNRASSTKPTTRLARNGMLPCPVPFLSVRAARAARAARWLLLPWALLIRHPTPFSLHPSFPPCSPLSYPFKPTERLSKAVQVPRPYSTFMLSGQSGVSVQSTSCDLPPPRPLSVSPAWWSLPPLALGPCSALALRCSFLFF